MYIMSTSCLHHVSPDLPRGQPSSGIDVPTEALSNLHEVGLQIAAIAAMLSVNFSGLSLAKRKQQKRLEETMFEPIWYILFESSRCRLM